MCIEILFYHMNQRNDAAKKKKIRNRNTVVTEGFIAVVSFSSPLPSQLIQL